MNLYIYLFIFMAKIFENTIGTLRLIVVSNGKKLIGACLQGIIALTWAITAGMVVVDIKKDPIKIIFFILGSAIGSYCGSYLEELLAIGSNMLTVIVNKKAGNIISKQLRNKGYAVTIMDGKSHDKKRSVLMVMLLRKKRLNVVNMIKAVDTKALIVTEVASALYGGRNC